MATPIDIAKSRPAETAMPIATVIAALIARAIGVEDTDTILYLALALSFIPAGVTWMVELWRNRKSDEGGTTLESPSPGSP